MSSPQLPKWASSVQWSATWHRYAHSCIQKTSNVWKIMRPWDVPLWHLSCHASRKPETGSRFSRQPLSQVLSPVCSPELWLFFNCWVGSRRKKSSGWSFDTKYWLRKELIVVTKASKAGVLVYKSGRAVVEANLALGGAFSMEEWGKRSPPKVNIPQTGLAQHSARHGATWLQHGVAMAQHRLPTWCNIGSTMAQWPQHGSMKAQLIGPNMDQDRVTMAQHTV